VSESLDKLLALLDLEQIELDIFRGRSPSDHRQRVFGGQVAGQALVAAGRTVPADRPVHSLHAYFIRPGDPAVPIVYIVDRVRDGRSFTTRRVSAIQHGKVIFTLSASFHHDEPGPEHGAAMPDAPPPESVAPTGERLEKLFGVRAHESFRNTPIELRFAGNQAKFAFSGMEFVTKLVEGKFPDYNRVIPKNHKNAIVLGRAPLLASLQRAAIMTSEKFKGVRVNVEPGNLRIAATNAEQEEAKEELEVDYNGDAIEIGFNVTYLIDALANLTQEMVKLELQDSNSSALITVPEQVGFKYVVMPMRI